jgi:hypothetical protein
MDAVKGRCNRDPCRYFHPPLHLQAQIKAAQSRASAVCYAFLGRTLAIFSILSVFLLIGAGPAGSSSVLTLGAVGVVSIRFFLQANSS